MAVSGFTIGFRALYGGFALLRKTICGGLLGQQVSLLTRPLGVVAEAVAAVAEFAVPMVRPLSIHLIQ